jgi:hypothetical protein
MKPAYGHAPETALDLSKYWNRQSDIIVDHVGKSGGHKSTQSTWHYRDYLGFSRN